MTKFGVFKLMLVIYRHPKISFTHFFTLNIMNKE